MAMFNGLKPLSAKIITLMLAILLLVTGTTFFGFLERLDISMLYFGLGLVLLIEVGLKITTPLSSLKKAGILQYISIGLALVLIISGVFALPFVTTPLPNTLASITNIVVIATTGLIVAEAFM